MKGLVVEPNLNQMVAMMSRTLISRPNVEKVVTMAKLDTSVTTEDQRNALIGDVSNRLSISSAGSENFYTISFVDKSAEASKRVVESLLQLFVQGSRGEKREDSESARAFINQQLEQYRKKLVESENAIMAFKRRHLGQLPGDGANYYTRLLETQTALSEAELKLKEAENSAESIRQQLSSASRTLPLRDGGAAAKPAAEETELDIRIRALEKRLDELRLIYTEEHPDIVAIIPMIAQLKERKAEETRQLQEKREAEAKRTGVPPNPVGAENPVYQQLTVALTQAEAEVAVLRTRVSEYRRRYERLRAAANELPKVEAEYTQLTRDYEVNKGRYDELLKRRESAEISGDLEDTDTVMGFRVVDPPRLPTVPIGPGRHVMATLVLLAALGCGVGAAWLVSQLRPTIDSESAIKEVTGLPVLGTVVMALTHTQKRQGRRSIVAFSASLAGLITAYVAVVATFMHAVSRI
jgi:polysaccharide chain length determinant protein (PEP-CTERM system associated)